MTPHHVPHHTHGARWHPALVLLLAAWSVPSCIAYENPYCAEDESEIVGYTTTALDVRPEYVRAQEAPLGNLVADSLYARLQPLGAQIALIDAGSLRADDGCDVVDEIAAGPVRRAQIQNVLAGSGPFAMVQVTATELRAALELAVSALGGPAHDPALGMFVQVSHLRYTVDCTRTPHLDGSAGGRITDVSWIDEAGVPQPLVDTSPSTGQAVLYRIATTSFVAGGTAGLTTLNRPLPLAGLDQTDAVVAAYVSSAPQRTISPRVNGRITLGESCTLLLP